METIISIPDSTFNSAEKLAKRLGISRSQLYSNAIATFIDTYGNSDVKGQLDIVFKTNTSASFLDKGIEALQSQSLTCKEW